MAVLNYKEYTLTPNGYGSYDLGKKVIRTKNNSGEKYEAIQNIGYGYSFESAMKRVVQHITDDKLDQDEITTLKGYIDTYRQEVDSLKQFINLNK